MNKKYNKKKLLDKLINKGKKTLPKEVIKSNKIDDSYEINYNALIPLGKFKGKSLNWVKENNKKYYNWILKENIINSWNLLKLKQKQNYDHFLNDNGEIWIEIYTIYN